MRAVITGGDSGIGRTVAIAYAREGADVLIAYLIEHDDAQEVKALVEQEGRRAILIAGDIGTSEHCRSIIKHAVGELGRRRVDNCAAGPHVRHRGLGQVEHRASES